MIFLTSWSFYLFSQQPGQKIMITGVVTDAGKQPVEGAAIFVDGVKSPVVTDSLGDFKVLVNKDARKIMAKSDSSGNGKARIKGKGNIHITLNGGKSHNSGAANSKDQDLKRKYSSYTNIYELIRSEVPGVLVRGSEVTVQGTGTFGGDNTPLFIVDGIPAEQIDDISPADVKSIRVVKGADAARYGMRGANGVLIIDTYRGGENK